MSNETELTPQAVAELATRICSPEYQHKIFLAAMAERSAFWLEVCGDQKSADEERAKYPWPKL